MSVSFTYSDNLIRCAKDGLTKPEDFGYWGSDDTFKTWGFCGIDKHRDSGVLDRSNFEVITKDLMSKYPEDFRIEGYGHWAVGHVDRLVCRILKNERDGLIEENITDAFREAMDWQDNLKDYPIANESHFSEMEYEEIIDSIKHLPYYLTSMINTDEDDWYYTVYEELAVNMNCEFCPDAQIYPKDNEILMAVYSRELWNEEEIELWEDFCLENNLQFPPKKKDPNQLSLFDME